MTTEVLRNMIYARSPDARRPALRRARRGALPPGPGPGRGVGRGDHPPARRDRDRRAVGHGLERRGGRGVDADGARRDRGDHRGAPAGRARAPVHGRRAGRRAAAPAPDLRRGRRRAPAESGGRPPRRPRADARRPGPPAAPLQAVAHRGGRAPRRRADAARDRVRVLPGRLRPGGRAVPRRRDPPHRLRRSGRAAPHRRRASRSARRRRSRRARLRLVARRPRSGRRRAPRGHGPADEGGGRGGVHGRPAEGRVRDRDAVARASTCRPARWWSRSCRSSPASTTSCSRRGSTRSSPAAPGGAGSTTSATRSCCGIRSWPSTRSPDSRPGARTRSRRRSARPTTWRPTSCSATSARRRAGSSTCRSRSSTPTATPCRSPGSSSAPGRSSTGRATSAQHPDGDIEEYRALLAGLDEARRAAHAAQDSRLDKLRPGDVVMAPRRGGRAVVLKQERGRSGNRVLALTQQRTMVRLTPDDFPGPIRRLANVELPRPFAPRSPSFQRAAVALLRRLPTATRLRPTTPTPASRSSRPGCAPTRCTARPGPTWRCAARGRPTASPGRSPGSSAASRARPRRSPASSTACSRCWSRGATCDGWELLPSGRLLVAAQHRVRSRGGGGAAHRPARRSRRRRRSPAIVSCFVYQRRGPDSDDPMPPAPVARPGRPPAGRQPSSASGRTSASPSATSASARPRRPDPGFTAAIHAWADGDDLADILEDEEMTGGDFVRNVKQVIDLLRQIAEVAPEPDDRGDRPGRRRPLPARGRGRARAR